MLVDEIPVIVDTEAFTSRCHDVAIYNVELAFGAELKVVKWIESFEEFTVANGK